MRILVATTPGLGHILPVLPLARALRDRGNDVRWVVGPGFVDEVTRAGIDTVVAGMSVPERHAEFVRRHPDVGGLPVPERRRRMFAGLFAELAAPRMLDALLPQAEAFGADLIVHDASELASPIVAARLGLPTVCHGFGELVAAPTVTAASDVVAPLWASVGLDVHPYAGSYDGLYVDIYPPSLCSEAMDHVPVVQRCRPSVGVPASGELVYVTFGTVFNAVDDGFRAAVLGAADAADEVLVTVGPDGDPEAVGAVPANVAVERYVPQAEVLPRCAAVASHAGSGTFLAALAHGVPQLCLPRAADQWDNARNLERAGAGLQLHPEHVTRDAVRDAVARLRADDDIRAVAAAVAAEIAAMPPVEAVAAAVEAFATAASRPTARPWRRRA